jgi:hypothetical protein
VAAVHALERGDLDALGALGAVLWPAAGRMMMPAARRGAPNQNDNRPAGCSRSAQVPTKKSNPSTKKNDADRINQDPQASPRPL